NESHIESNSGGRSFARTIERLLWEKYKSRRTSVKWFHQSNNKMARIISNSSFVMNHVYFPFNWVDKWPEFAQEINTFQKEGKNKFDDGSDALTGLAELVNGDNRAVISSVNVW